MREIVYIDGTSRETGSYYSRHIYGDNVYVIKFKEWNTSVITYDTVFRGESVGKSPDLQKSMDTADIVIKTLSIIEESERDDN